ncbi:hypothetical protein BGZ61DRAFT_549698 [Ilyonectria robusta]|uniref:uncharacterized protein n=1 Tax=Ilyonectria robusta TaxID=1079257 RepID=UPI001E8E581C|nr:uncharacterized protein BGZ61DRAFT_549698 [Ilyonectria robusta]KAH8683977.1 hypothetical protein BGZ61DRAFT_549698 [Ilyonectria robusta]
MPSYAGLKELHSFENVEDIAYLIDAWKKLAHREGAAECSASARCVKPISQFGVLLHQKLWDACSSIAIVSFFNDLNVVGLVRLSGAGMQRRAWNANAWSGTLDPPSCSLTAAYRTSTALEGEALPKLFGQMGIVADTLFDTADRMIAASGN